MSNEHFRVNTPTVTHEIIDGEAVIINLDSGSYYSLVGVGAVVWDLLYQRAPVDQIITAITHSYEGDAAEIELAVRQLLEQLQVEGLVAPDESAPLAPANVATNQNGHQKTPFQVPVLQKYTDMQELLLLDPIHDVDDMGWPKPNPEVGK